MGGTLLLIAVTLVAYLPAMRAGFIWDDDLLLTGNPLVDAPGGLPSIWFSDAAVDYTPLTLTAFRLEWILWNSNPLGYHLVNIFLHIASTLLLWRVLTRLSIPGAWLGAAFFSVHPVNVASVAWIAEQKNTLSLFFFLLTMDWFISFQASGRWWRYLIALAAAAASLLSKGSTVVLPLILLCSIWARDRKVRAIDVFSTVPFFALGVAMALVTIWRQHRFTPGGAIHESATFRLIRAGDAVWFYLGKDVFPFGLAPVYRRWSIDPSQPAAYLPVAGLCALVLVFWLARASWGRAYFLALVYFLISLLPVLGFVDMGFMDQAYVADWWQQIALIAVTVLAGSVIADWWRKTAGRFLRPAIAAIPVCIIALFATLTWLQAETYHSMETYSRRALLLNPDSWSAHTNLASVLQGQGRLDEAIDHLHQALRLNPLNEEAHNNLGNALHAKGEEQQAIDEFQQALGLNPRDGDAHSNLGLALQAEGRYDDAIAEYDEALRLKPVSAEAQYNLGSALKAEGMLDAAASHYSEALRIRPAFAEARNNLANILQKQGKAAEAIPEYREVLRVKPDDAFTWFNLATALEACGQYDGAIAAYRQAMSLRPLMIAAHWNLGMLLYKLKRVDEGLAEIQKTLDLHPAEIAIYYSAASLFKECHHDAQAAAADQAALTLHATPLRQH